MRDERLVKQINRWLAMLPPEFRPRRLPQYRVDEAREEMGKSIEKMLAYIAKTEKQTFDELMAKMDESTKQTLRQAQTTMDSQAQRIRELETENDQLRGRIV